MTAVVPPTQESRNVYIGAYLEGGPPEIEYMPVETRYFLRGPNVQNWPCQSQFGGKMTTPFKAPAVMPHSPDGSLTFEILKYVLTRPDLSSRIGLDEAQRLSFSASEENAEMYWRNCQAAAAQLGTPLLLEDLGLPQNHLAVPDLSGVEGLVPADPNGTPFFVPQFPRDDPGGGVSYDRFKTLIANPETRVMLGLDDTTASWIMRSEEGAFMWYQQALANENQEADLARQESFRQIESHIKSGFNYAQGAALAAIVVMGCIVFFLFAS